MVTNYLSKITIPILVLVIIIIKKNCNVNIKSLLFKKNKSNKTHICNALLFILEKTA